MKSQHLSHKSQLAIGAAILALLAWAFVTWLCNYSSTFPIGLPKMTHQVNPAWSPDEKYVAFECHYNYPSDGYDNVSWNNPMWGERTGEICIVDMETKEFKRLTYGRYKTNPVWSPDGTELTWYDKRSQLFVGYNLQTKKIDSNKDLSPKFEQYAERHDNSQNTDLSPNKQYLLEWVDLPPDEPYHGYLFSITENGRKAFESNFRVYPNPAWSPDSSILAVRKSRDKDNEQEVIFIYLPTKEMASIKLDFSAYFVSWSPDREKVIFQGVKNDLENDNYLEVVSFQFSQTPFSYSIIKRESFTLRGMVYEDVMWSSHGGYITFMSEEFFFPDIWILDMKNGEQTPLIATPSR
jgi:Tol biopolymer transport system component